MLNETQTVLDEPNDQELPVEDENDFEALLEQLAEADQEIVSKIQGKYALVKVSLSRWRGDYKVEKAEVFLEDDNLTDKKHLLSKPYWHLLPPTWKQRFDAIEQQKDEILNAYSVPTQCLFGIRIVMADRLEECCSRLGALQDRFEELVDEFCTKDNHDELHAYVENELHDKPASFKSAKKRIPSREVLRKSFSMERVVIPAALPQWAMGNSNSFHAQELQRSERQLMASNLTTMVQRPRENLGLVMTAMIDQLATTDNTGELVAAKKRRLTRNSVDALRREIETLVNFDDLIEDALVEHLKELDNDLEDLRNDLEEDVEEKEPLCLNTDNDLAVHWAKRLLTARDWITSKESMVAGLKKMCQVSGVSL